MKHIVKHAKSLFIVTIATIVLFFALFYAWAYLGDIAASKIAQREAEKAQEILEKEGQRLLEQAREVAALEDVRHLIEAGDSDNLAPILVEEMQKRDINILQGVTAEGIVVTRAHALARRGDDVFSTTPWGRRTRDGEEVITYGEGRTQPFLLIATHPIMEDGELKGAVFAGYSFDSDFVREFRDKYMPEGSHMLFYGSVKGITGSSFEDEKSRRLIATYMNIGSDYLQGRKHEDKIILADQPYTLYNMPLEGLEGESGGGLLFLKVNHAFRSLIISLLVSISFAAIFYLVEVKRSEEKFFKRHLASSAVIFIGILVLSFVYTQFLQYKYAVKIGDSPFTIYNSTLSLTPNYDVYGVNSQQRIGIEIETGGEAINVAGVYLRYDPQMVRVDDIITTNSFCSQNLFVERSFDNALGQVRIVCGLPTPGFPSEARSLVAEILVTPLQEGYFSLNFTDETAVLANDGLGTNVLRYAENAGYQVIATDETSISGAPPQVPVFSSTHPNRERKYNTRKINFSWPTFPGHSYAYEFGTDAEPGSLGENITSEHNLSFTVSSDGAYYLHLAATNEGTTGPVTTYPVIVDITPPDAPVIRTSSTSVPVNEVVRFEFGADENDDLQPNFYLKINNGTFVPTTSQVFIPFFEPGTNRITVRVFDNAGNFSDSAVDITVRGLSRWSRFFYVDFRNWFR